MRRALDVLTLLYFAVHVPITILFDSQVKGYNKFVAGMSVSDPVEGCVQVVCGGVQGCYDERPPGLVLFFLRAEASKWIRIPNLVYSTHVATTVVAIVAHIMFEDFSEYKIPTPQTLQERLILIGIYLPFLVVPFIMMLDTLFSSAYREKSKQN
ncbi:hypothetical protein ScPMuIL_005284 [Solemya velum]